MLGEIRRDARPREPNGITARPCLGNPPGLAPDRSLCLGLPLRKSCRVGFRLRSLLLSGCQRPLRLCDDS